ncbi:MAG: 2,4-dihydroxyhept-2-ene,7-dioic acid aldolase [Verrucomicrobia bacterium]|nr:2,4-dihydroxyhept-2-ene,7-dioic acid aldolase [Verrucomicrobiota bacterium]
MQSRKKLREALAAGKTVGGMIQFIGHPLMNELMATAGADFVIIDMEHSATDLERIAQIIFAAEASGVTPFVRVPTVDRALIARLLNAGAAGIVLPHANRASCAELVQAVRYSPDGTRGACPMVRAKNYTRGNWETYAAEENRDVMVIPMIEERESLEDFEALAAMPGLNPLMIGATDLAIALGAADATSFDHPKMAAALDNVIRIARKHGKYVMCGIGKKLEIDVGRRVAQRGVQLLVYGTDCDLFMDGLRRIAAVKSPAP